MVVGSSNWSQLARPRSAVPTALTWQTGCGRVGCVVAVGDDEGRRPVARGVAVEQAQRRRDHAGVQVVGQVHGVAVDGLRVEGGVPPAVEGDLAQLLAGQPELVHAALGHQGHPVDGGDRPEGEGPLEEAREPGHPATAPTAPADALAPAARPGRWTPTRSGRRGRVGPARPPRPGRRRSRPASGPVPRHHRRASSGAAAARPGPRGCSARRIRRCRRPCRGRWPTRRCRRGSGRRRPRRPGTPRR